MAVKAKKKRKRKSNYKSGAKHVKRRAKEMKNEDSANSYLKLPSGVEYFKPVSVSEKETIIRDLESRKRSYDLAIQGGNWRYDI